MVELQNVNASTVQLATGNELFGAKNNEVSFTVRCTVRGSYGSEVSAAYEVIGHALFVPRAVQSYDPEEENYNPALIIYLKNNESTTGATLHAYEGGKGYYMTQQEAAAVTNLGTINGLTQIQDVDGVVVESWDGDVNTQPYYRFEDFDQWQYFKNCLNLSDISGCQVLKTITTPSNLSSSNTAIYLPNSLLTIKVSEGVMSIPMIQKNNDGLNVYLPKTFGQNNIFNTNGRGFSGIRGFGDIHYGGSLQEWINLNIPTRRNDFGNNRYFNDLYCNKEKVTTIPASASNKSCWYGCKSITTIEGTIDSLNEYDFALCSNLENITLSPDITSIPANCFYGCSKLNLTEIPSKVTSIGANALSGTACSFTEIPDSVTSFGAQQNMPNIVDISYPNTMAAPGGFTNCANLRSVFFRKGNESEYYITSMPNFSGCTNLSKVGYGEKFVNNTIAVLPNVSTSSYTKDTNSNNLLNIFNIISNSALSLFSGRSSNSRFNLIKCGNSISFAGYGGGNGFNILYGYNLTSIKGDEDYGITVGQWFINTSIPPVLNILNRYGCSYPTKCFIPTSNKIDYIQGSDWNTRSNILVEYDYINDPANIVDALQESDIVTTGIPLANCAISINSGTATITCTDSTFTSAIPIKLHYRINGGAWSSPVNTGATFAVSANDVIEVYATHSLRAPSNRLKATYDGTNITYDWTDIYIAPDDVDANGLLIE